ncbi:hypothetical protein GCM10010279_34380 [Streptomyces mutabilis]|nr:hypothetical protein GCM10010279_34380 [Streptomyces mutabilis]
MCSRTAPRWNSRTRPTSGSDDTDIGHRVYEARGARPGPRAGELGYPGAAAAGPVRAVARRWGSPYPNRGTDAANSPYW